MTLAQWLVLGAGVVLVGLISRRALLHPRRHGFYRFFALVATMALLVLNIPWWFADAWTPLRVIDTALLYVALALVASGFFSLWRHGQPGPERDDAALLAFEKTRHLVRCGIYRWIRHPMYLSLLLVAWGSMLKQVTPLTLVLALMATGFVVLAVRADERECAAWFGEPYRDYMRHSRRFIPGVW